MPDVPSTLQTSTVADTTASAAGSAASGAVPVPAPKPVEHVVDAVPVPVPKAVEHVAEAVPTPKVAEAVVDASTPASSPAPKPTQVVDAIDHVAAPAAKTVDPVVTATTTTVTKVADPVVSAAGPATGGTGSAVKQTVDTVAATTGQATAPVRPVVDTVASTTAQAAAPVRPLVDAAAATPSIAAHAADPAASGLTGPGAVSRLADAIPGTPVPAATGDALGAAAVARPSSAVDALPIHAATGPRAGLVDTLATTHAVDPGGLAATPPAPDPTTASLLAHTATAPAPGSGATHSATVDTLAQVAADPRLLAVTGVTALAGTAYVAARAAGCVAGGDQGVILNNVRLIPCLVRSSVASSGTALAALGSGVREAAGSAATTARDELHVLDERISRAADDARKHVVVPFRDGVARATGQLPGESGAGGSDLFFMGIGMAVGLLYAAILSLWLFLVRPRWSTRA